MRHSAPDCVDPLHHPADKEMPGHQRRGGAVGRAYLAARPLTGEARAAGLAVPDFAVICVGSHKTVMKSGHDARTINDKERHSMECEDFLEPIQDQEYDDDL